MNNTVHGNKTVVYTHKAAPFSKLGLSRSLKRAPESSCSATNTISDMLKLEAGTFGRIRLSTPVAGQSVPGGEPFVELFQVQAVEVAETGVGLWRLGGRL